MDLKPTTQDVWSIVIEFWCIDAYSGSERPKLKQTNSNSSVTEETKGPKGILKSPNPVKGVIFTGGVKPPVPSRNKVNEKLELRSEEVRLLYSSVHKYAA